MHHGLASMPSTIGASFDGQRMRHSSSAQEPESSEMRHAAAIPLEWLLLIAQKLT